MADKAAPSIDGRDGEEHGGSACDEAGSKQQASYFVTHPPPVGRRAIVLVRTLLPVSICPRVVAEGWGVAQLSLGYAGPIAA